MTPSSSRHRAGPGPIEVGAAARGASSPEPADWPALLALALQVQRDHEALAARWAARLADADRAGPADPERAAPLDATEQELRRRMAEWEALKQAEQARLEHDRRLLADAWVRLEREQLGRGPQPAAPRPVPSTNSGALPPRDEPTPGADPDGDPGWPGPPDSVIQQFQQVRRDVRQTATRRRSRERTE